MKKIKNPIIAGFYPDPSIVRVEDDFYLVNSTFEYYPAIPIWHSRDLVHWKQIGNVIDREEQGLDLSNVNPSGGVMAATIRYNDGTFYVSSTRIPKECDDWGNNHFICESKNPKGPWSKCHFIKDAYGIDSSLFFDDDGKSYFIANRESKNYSNGKTEIWIQEINLKEYKLVGEKHALWSGIGGLFPEGPHIYKRNGYYYLLIAEGGTLHNHTVTMARSKNIFGPYEGSVRNPLLTHKNLLKTHPIQNVGHADLVELKNHEWYGVCLASRPRGGYYNGFNVKYTFGGYYRNLGRETFIFPVVWPDDISPLFSPITGKLEFSYDAPKGLVEKLEKDVPINFSNESLKIKWCTIKKATKDNVSLVRKNNIMMQLLNTYEDSFIGVRQTSWKFNSSVDLSLIDFHNNDVAAILCFLKYNTYIGVEITKSNDKNLISFVRNYNGNYRSFVSYLVDCNDFKIIISANDQDYLFSVFVDGKKYEKILDGKAISPDLNDAHTGVFIALTGKSDRNSKISWSNFKYNKTRPTKQ